MKRARRLTAAELAQIAGCVSERDRDIVRTVLRFRLVAMPQIERLYFTSGTPASNARQARATLQRLTDLRVLHRLERRIGGIRAGSAAHVYCLGSAGHYLAGLEAPEARRRRPKEPGLPYVRHTLAVTELYVRLTEAQRAAKVELIEFTPEPACWRSFFGPGGARAMLKPDAFVRTGNGDMEELHFVEVDQATEGTEALRRKFRAYRAYWQTGREQARWDGTFPRVLWLGPSVTRLRTLIDVAASQPPESWKLFGVRLYEEAVSAFIPKEPS